VKRQVENVLIATARKTGKMDSGRPITVLFSVFFRDCGFRFSENSLSALIEETKKLDTATETKTVAEKEKAYTIALRAYRLNQLIEKGADLNNTDSVETVLATEPLTV
jgi:hypothetical protein